MHFLILACFPLDFLRLFWVLTPLDVVAIPYLLIRLGSGKISRFTLIVALSMLLVIGLVVSVSAVLNPLYTVENMIALAGITFSLAKAVAFLEATEAAGDRFLEPLIFGYLGLNAVMFALLLNGTGFSGSGRFAGVFAQSNGMAAFAVSTFCISLGALWTRRRGIAAILGVSAVTMITLSGSRGSFLAVFVLLGVFAYYRFQTAHVALKALGLLAMISTASGLLFAGPTILKITGELMVQSGYTGVERVGRFLLIENRTELLDEFASSRGNLNEAALNAWLAEPTLFGKGYESSQAVLAMGNRVHNIFLSSLVELGLFGSMFFVSLALAGVLVVLRGPKGSATRLVLSLLFITVMLQAIKTPFYFLNCASWATALFVVRDLLVRNASAMGGRTRQMHSVTRRSISSTESDLQQNRT